MATKVNTDVSMDEYDRISKLPQVLLQHIQYYLSPKQATQTIVLSKAWRNTWSNNSRNVNFDKDFCKGKTQDEILSLAKNTLQRYHDQKLRVMDFELRLSECPESCTFLDEWIPIVVHMGVKRFSLKLKGDSHSITYNLPRAVFEAESITELSIKGCELDAQDDVIMIKNLKVLKLSGVHIVGNTFRSIISSCSNLESIEIIELCSCSNWFPVHYFQVLPNLKNISLTSVKLDETWFDSLSFHFPSLEKLEVTNVYRCTEIKILSDSIKHISLWGIQGPMEKVHVNAPNLLSFELMSDTHPTLYFAKTSSKWESEIQLVWEKQESSWLNKLNDMLKELGQSEIISLEFYKLPTNCPLNDDSNNNIVQQFEPVEMKALEIPFTKNLSSDVINGLFCVCRPIMVYLWKDTDEDVWSKSESKEFVENMCKILMKTGESSSSITSNQQDSTQLWKEELKEVIGLSIYDYTLDDWRPLQYETSSGECALTNEEYQQCIHIRFELKWTDAKACTLTG